MLLTDWSVLYECFKNSFNGCVCRVFCDDFKKCGKPALCLVTMAVSVLIIIAVAGKISGIISQITKLSSYLSNAGQYMALMIKIIGITYVVQFTSDLCRDSGYSALAGQVEVFGKITIAAVSIPVVSMLLETVEKCVGY